MEFTGQTEFIDVQNWKWWVVYGQITYTESCLKPVVYSGTIQ